MHILNSSLLFTEGLQATAKKNVRGSYHPLQFVLRLNKDIHRELRSMKGNYFSIGELPDSTLQSYSTYLHETIHWWQHVGSTFGFISSLSYPAQSHVVMSDLKHMLTTQGAFKSIIKYEQLKHDTLGHGWNDSGIHNIINYWYDLQFASWLSRDPAATVGKINGNPYFISTGHCYHMMYRSSIMLIANLFDRRFTFLPEIFSWQPHFNELKEKNVTGFGEYQPIGLPPFGSLAVFEGQARFSQLQFLCAGMGETITMNDFDKANLLNGIYGTAFKYYLDVVQQPMPTSVLDPLVGLFLLLCDIAINPSEGFPFAIDHYEQFISNTDPGHRFYKLCLAVRENTRVLSAIQNYSKEEYIEVSKVLSKYLGSHSPYENCELIVNKWMSKQQSIIELLLEENSFQYQEADLPIRLFFSKFLRFQQDKLHNPQLFCWPGINTIGHKSNQLSVHESFKIVSKHQALFIDDVDGGIYPSLFDNYSTEQIQDTFEKFFTWNAVYNMVRQWISEDGPFRFDFQWLTSKHSNEEINGWISKIFTEIFGISPADFKIL